MVRSDGKRPDGVAEIPWLEGTCVSWYVTVTDTLAASNVCTSSSAAGSAAEAAACKKLLKYADIMNRYTFVLIAFVPLGPNTAGTDFIAEIGRIS